MFYLGGFTPETSVAIGHARGTLSRMGVHKPPVFLTSIDEIVNRVLLHDPLYHEYLGMVPVQLLGTYRFCSRILRSLGLVSGLNMTGL